MGQASTAPVLEGPVVDSNTAVSAASEAHDGNDTDSDNEFDSADAALFDSI
jgi:hypothetical protein